MGVAFVMEPIQTKTLASGVTMQLGKINDRWPLWMTPDRYEFHDRRHGWEKERLATCAEMMTPGMVVYDIGSESFDFTCLYKTWVGESGTVVGIEPSPPYWASARAHWEGNDLGPPPPWFMGFASDHTAPAKRDDGMAHLRQDEGTGWPVASLLEVQPDFGFRHLAQQADTTPQITMDDLASSTGLIPDAMVMDIEGAEWHALQGCAHLLATKHPIMWVSIHPATMLDWYGKTVDDIVQFMAGFGYTAEMLGEDSEQYWLFV